MQCITDLKGVFMRSFLAVLAWVVLASVSAQAADLGDLSRKLSFVFEDDQLEGTLDLFFTTEREGAFYYQGLMNAHDDDERYFQEPQVFAKIEKQGERLILSLVRDDRPARYDLELPARVRPGTRISAVAAWTPNGETRFIEETVHSGLGIPFWIELPEPQSASLPLQLTALSRAFAENKEDRATGEVLVKGPMDFRPCDGCEHGDQLMIEGPSMTVNAVEMPFGRYYEADCRGKLHPWLEQMMLLGVPFVFKGGVTSLTMDLWEGSFWTARMGAIYLDAKAKVGLVEFLDSIPALIAESYDEKSSWRWDLDQEGRFLKYEMSILVFRFEDREILLDTMSGKVLVRENP